MKFECPRCGQHLTATTDQIGIVAPCPGCGTSVTVPRPVPPPVSQPAPAPQGFPGIAGPPRKTCGLARSSLVYGIISVISLCCGGISTAILVISGAVWILATIPAIICGHIARARIRRSAGTLGGGGLALTGLILGYANLALLIVFVVLAMRFTGQLDVARGVKVRGDLQRIKTNLMMYQAANGFYPTTDQGLKALVQKPDTDPKPRNWHQLDTQVPRDPWGTEYSRYPGKHNPKEYDLWSAGPDRNPVTEKDNIGNWEPTNN